MSYIAATILVAYWITGVVLSILGVLEKNNYVDLIDLILCLSLAWIISPIVWLIFKGLDITVLVRRRP